MTIQDLGSHWLVQLKDFPVIGVAWLVVTLCAMWGIKFATGDSVIDILIKLIRELKDLLQLRPTAGALNALLLIIILTVFLFEVTLSPEATFVSTREAVENKSADGLANWLLCVILLSVVGLFSVKLSKK